MQHLRMRNVGFCINGLFPSPSAPHLEDPMNVSEFVWHRLSEWELKRVYGYPGDGIGGPDVGPTSVLHRKE